MPRYFDCRTLAYFLILLGGAFSSVVAVVPFYTAGYLLRVDLLLVGLLPYVVYGAFTHTVRGWPLVLSGVAILVVDLIMEIPERFLNVGNSDSVVFAASLLSTFVVLPIGLGAGALLQRRRA